LRHSLGIKSCPVKIRTENATTGSAYDSDDGL
jgi:hypothetical protein